MKENYCKKCGMCCQAIALQYSVEYIETCKDSPDAKFILENWQPITMEEALSINPHLQLWIDVSVKRNITLYFYKCNQLDLETNLCKIHSTKEDFSQPRICIDYPFYTRYLLPKSELFYSPECGYNRDDLKYQEDFLEK